MTSQDIKDEVTRMGGSMLTQTPRHRTGKRRAAYCTMLEGYAVRLTELRGELCKARKVEWPTHEDIRSQMDALLKCIMRRTSGEDTSIMKTVVREIDGVQMRMHSIEK